MTKRIGFIGQGWIGKNYADDFEARGYSVVRYSLEEPYLQNQDLIKDCNVTFIAVPTPTTPEGFDSSYLKEALSNIAPGQIAVIKSTTIPGLVTALQDAFPDIILLHSPEFLVEKTAAFDAAHPNRNIIGLPKETTAHRRAAEKVLSVLPVAPYNTIMSSLDSELVKYAGNCFLFTKIIFMNTLFDLCAKSGADFNQVRQALVEDPRIGASHTEPNHESGRGAGGHCFIKDFEAFRQFYGEVVATDEAWTVLTAAAIYNNQLLIKSNKDIDLLETVYGKRLEVK